jgi:hypothetical protein
MSRYFDVEDILAESSRVPTQFLTRAYNLGHLDASSCTADIEEGQRVELPLWIAEPLSRGRYVVVDLPRGFSSAVRSRGLRGVGRGERGS